MIHLLSVRPRRMNVLDLQFERRIEESITHTYDGSKFIRDDAQARRDERVRMMYC